MASAVVSMVPTTASRFALLQVDSSSDSDSEKARGAHATGKARSGSAAKGKSKGNEKKKEKRRKKKEQQQSEANELRNLAFKKIPSKPSQGIGGALQEHSTHNVPKEYQEDDWQQWQQRDEQLTSDMFEADLEKALMLSKLEYEESKDNGNEVNGVPQSKKVNKKDKRRNNQGKDKPLTVPLKDFQLEGIISLQTCLHRSLYVVFLQAIATWGGFTACAYRCPYAPKDVTALGLLCRSRCRPDFGRELLKTAHVPATRSTE
ncbi:hypothetical protein XENTR_v10001806 [Xenopus tropicalis]|nr:hypothetical protein XENTR_v10001806 [Xenopus tropicalis]